MYPYGFSADVISPKSYIPEFYMGPGDDGFSHDFVFEAKGYLGLLIRLSHGPNPDKFYWVQIGVNSNKRVKIVRKPSPGQLLAVDHASNHAMALKTDRFTRYRIQLILEGPSKLKIVVGNGYSSFESFASVTDEGDIIAVDTVALL